MVEFEIYKKEKEKDEVYLDLEKDETGEARLIARDREGNRLNCGNILEITKDGELIRCVGCGVPGIQTDHVGRINLESKTKPQELKPDQKKSIINIIVESLGKDKTEWCFEKMASHYFRTLFKIKQELEE